LDVARCDDSGIPWWIGRFERGSAQPDAGALDGRLAGASHDSAGESIDEIAERLRHLQSLAVLGRLAASIAHDFNNLLTPIVGYTQLALADVGASSPASERLDEVLLAASRAQALVRSILGIGRGRPIERSVVRASAVVEETLRLMRTSIPAGVRVELRAGGGLGPEDLDDRVLADPGQLGQVLVNLCTNAVHAMGACGGILGVEIGAAPSAVNETSSAPPSERFVEIAVSDTGTGIAPEHLDAIFEPFFTTDRGGGGSGMGLAIARGIVADHGGTITVESEPGRGTRFHVLLPGHRLDADVPLAAPPPDGPDRLFAASARPPGRVVMRAHPR
jgi:two-component system cell cycle sensor histidine kinase/response regulator CckA